MEEETPVHEGLVWDHPYYLLNGEPVIPCIFDRFSADSKIPDGFNAVTIRLEGHMRADLDWRKAIEEARIIIQQGYLILWEIDLGLFSHLTYSLSQQTQFLSLTLSLEHFRDTIWKEFKDNSLGLILYRGFANFSLDLVWDEALINNLQEWFKETFKTLAEIEGEINIPLSDFTELTPSLLLQTDAGKQLLSLFSRDVAVEYLLLLRNRLPDTLACYLLLDVEHIQSPLWQTQLLHAERFEQLSLAVKGAKVPLRALGWMQPSPYGLLSSKKQVNLEMKPVLIGICLPAMDTYKSEFYTGLEKVLEKLIKDSVPFRVIPENYLITDWDGLDYLIYVPEGLSVQGKRKLQGFCAAGGTAVTVGRHLGLAQELSWEDFSKTSFFEFDV